MPVWPPEPGSVYVAPPPWANILVIIVSALFFSLILYRGYRAGKSFRWEISISLAAFLIGVAVNRGYDQKLLSFLTRTVGPHFTQFLVAVTVIAVGWGAHLFKRRNQLVYGYVEAFIGVMSAIAIVSRTNFAAVQFTTLTLAQYGTLVGCAYVVARGLNNVQDAKDRNRQGETEITSSIERTPSAQASLRETA
jgi:hypothetical protein